MDGPEAPGPDPAAEADWVVTTVVDPNDTGEFVLPVPPVHDLVDRPDSSNQQLEEVVGRLVAIEGRLATAEATPTMVENLRQAVQDEFERHVAALTGHEQTLVQLGQVLVDLLGRMDTADANAAAGPAGASPAMYEQALGHLLERLKGLDRRLQVLDRAQLDGAGVDGRVGALEARIVALDPLPAVVRALRAAVRADEEVLAAEVVARNHAGSADGVAQAEALEGVAGRLSVAEGRLAPLATLADDVAALSRIVRRELDAVTADVRAREQVLRRALQKEIERLQDTSADRGEAMESLAQRLTAVEGGLRSTAQAQEDAVVTATDRVEEIESRLGSVDGLAQDLDAMRAGFRRDLERLRAITQTQEQSAAETAKRFAAGEERLTRLDALPGEVQSLRSAMRQDAERTIVTLRSIEERTGELSARTTRQLRQLADAVTEAHEHGGRLTSDVEATRATIRSMQIALAEVTERLDTLDSQRDVDPPLPKRDDPPG